MDNTFLVIIIILFSIIIFSSIAWKPFLGIVFMLCTLPLQVYTQLPGINFSSTTAIFGLSAFLSFILRQPIIRRKFIHSTSVQPSKHWNWLYFGIVLFYLIILIGELFKPISTGFDYVFTYFQLLILVWLVPQLFTSLNEIEALMKFYIGANIIGVLISLNSYSADSLNRLAGLQGNANEFALYLSIAILMLIYFFVTYPKKIISALLIGILIFPLLFSGSRGAVLFLIPAILLQLWLMRRKKYLLIIFILSGIAILLGTTLIVLPDSFIERILNIPQDIIFGNETVGLRYTIWRYGLELWKEKPVFGIGTGLFVFYSRNIVGLSRPTGIVLHNMYLTHLTENGIVGLSIFLYILIESSFNFIKGIRQSVVGSIQRNISTTWFSILIYISLNGIKGNYQLNKMMWFCFAISITFLTFIKMKDCADLP